MRARPCTAAVVDGAVPRGRVRPKSSCPGAHLPTRPGYQAGKQARLPSRPRRQDDAPRTDKPELANRTNMIRPSVARVATHAARRWGARLGSSAAADPSRRRRGRPCMRPL